jgi:hypothetical protein
VVAAFSPRGRAEAERARAAPKSAPKGQGAFMNWNRSTGDFGQVTGWQAAQLDPLSRIGRM